MFKHDCKIHGHRFEARYSEIENPFAGKLLERLEKANGLVIKGILDRSTMKKYECDICTKCGKIIKNKE